MDVQNDAGIEKAEAVASLNAFSSAVIVTIYLSLNRLFGVTSNLMTSSITSFSFAILKASFVRPSLHVYEPSTYSFNTKPNTKAVKLHGKKPYGSCLSILYISVTDTRPSSLKDCVIFSSTAIFILEIGMRFGAVFQ